MDQARAATMFLMCTVGFVACGDGRPQREQPPTDASTRSPSIDASDHRAQDSGRTKVDAAPSTRATDAGVDAGDMGSNDGSVPPDGAVAADATPDAPVTDGGSSPDASAPAKLRYYPGFWLKATGPIEIDANLEDRQLDRIYRWIKDDAQLKGAVVGILGMEAWRTYEPDPPDGWSAGQPVPQDLAKHHFDWTQMDRILAWCEKRGLRFWVTLGVKTFNDNDRHPAPDWALADFEYNRPADSDGKCKKRGNIVPIWETKARDAWAVFLRAFVLRYGDDERLGVLSFEESDGYCSELPNYTKEGYSRGQMHMMTVARQAGPTLNIVKMLNFNLWEMIADHGRSLSPPVGMSWPDARPFKGYPDSSFYANTHRYAKKHADQIPVFGQVQASDLHRIGCENPTAWKAVLPQCKTEGHTPCSPMDLACYMIEHLRVDGIAFATYEDKRTEILAAIRAYKDALPASAFKP